jgi:hypothetical protein
MIYADPGSILISPHAGQELAPGIRQRRIGCCGFTGPSPPPLSIKMLLDINLFDL